MRFSLPHGFMALTLSLSALLAGGSCVQQARAQGQELQEPVADIKEASVKNKQQLAQYTWNELVTISLKGEEKKQEHFQVRLGPDGKPQKTSLDPPADTDESGGRLKRHVVAKKKEEFKDYADQMKALAQQYVSPDKDLIQQSYQKGNIALGAVPGMPNEVKLIVHNYIKPQDSMTNIFYLRQNAKTIARSANRLLYG
jgi:hypothetical protein